MDDWAGKCDFAALPKSKIAEIELGYPILLQPPPAAMDSMVKHKARVSKKLEDHLIYQRYVQTLHTKLVTQRLCTPDGRSSSTKITPLPDSIPQITFTSSFFEERSLTRN